jgi:hypothetical protein
MEDVRLILSSLWIAVIFCSGFEAILGFLKPGYLDGVRAGDIDGIQVTQRVLVGNAVMMVIKSVMVFLSLTVPFAIIQWANIGLVILFIGIIIMQLGYYFTSGIQKWAYYYVFYACRNCALRIDRFVRLELCLS